MGVRDALVKAAEAELDLVEVAPTSVPPVCRIIDYGKYKYEQQKKSRGSHRRTSDIKGMRFSPKIGEHDFQVKARHVYEFLHEGNKRSEEHTSELQSRENLVCRLLLEKKKRSRRPPRSSATSDVPG